jgi:hypothetical protein
MSGVRERRRRRRVRTRQAAWIRTRANAKLLPCVLWDQSETGARIAAAFSDKLPEVFTLIDNKQSRLCRIIWWTNGLVGVRFLEASEASEDLPAAQHRKSHQAKAAPRRFDNVRLMSVARSLDTMQGPAKQNGFSISHIAAGFLLALVALTTLFYFAGWESGPGVVWAVEVCQEADSLCRHPEFSGGAAVLMALIYFFTKGMEL